MVSSLKENSSDKPPMGFDAVVANAGRLNILTALAVEEQQDFVQLRQRTALTDGNLACHARRLAAAGLIDIRKSFRDGKPVTQLTLTTAGRVALEQHARRVLAAISHRRITLPGNLPPLPAPPDEAAAQKPVDATAADATSAEPQKSDAPQS